MKVTIEGASQAPDMIDPNREWDTCAAILILEFQTKEDGDDEGAQVPIVMLNGDDVSAGKLALALANLLLAMDHAREHAQPIELAWRAFEDVKAGKIKTSGGTVLVSSVEDLLKPGKKGWRAK